jgi:tetratricopeptide (TPR) repeat protein
MLKLFAIFLLLLQAGPALSQQDATVREYLKAFTTYPYSDANPVALLSPVYPYFRYDGFTDKPVQKQWKVVELRNDLITVLITPEIGGKIWGAFENKTGRPFIYYNGAVKFRDVAMRGPWTSGGLEANYGIIGHAPSCAAPVDYTAYKNNDGSVSCMIGTLDLLTRSEWRVEINLPKDKAYFTTRSIWYNHTPISQPYYHWMNLGMPSKGGLEFIFPGTHYIGHEGEYADWPVNRSNGKRINFYEQNDFGGYKSYHVMGKLTHFFGAYYHDDDNGMVRYGTYDDKAGKKIWIWGLSRQGMIWEKMLTDTNGQYVEIQSGRLFNQNAPGSSLTPFKHIGFAPYATDTWTEYWYPVSGIRGMVEANAYGALNAGEENGWLKVYLSAVQKIDDVLSVREGEREVFSKRVRLNPMEVLVDSVRTDGGRFFVTLGGNKIVYNSDTAADVLHRPMEAPKDFDWSSAYGEYIRGRELMDQKLYAEAGEHLKQSLQKDANYLPALVEMAALQYRNMQFEDALATIRRALQVDALSGEANYYYGVINDRLNNTADAKDGYSIAAVTPEYRSAAYTDLARLAGKEGDYVQSVRYSEKAIDFNRRDIDALMLEAVAYRKLGDTAKASEILRTILDYDPLNHFARWEMFCARKGLSDRRRFVSMIRCELPHEVYAELAIWYYNAGYPAEAQELFAMDLLSVESICWRAFLQGRKVDTSLIDLTLAFPFRSETGAVLEHLLKGQDDWQLKYLLALVYRDRGRMDECKTLLKECGTEPGFAPFYAVRAAIFKTDSVQCLQDLQRALSLDKVQWRYHKLLAEYYIERGRPAEALGIIEPYHKAHPDQYIMGMLYAKALLLNKRYRDADVMLSKLHIIPFEGATEGRVLYREAKLMQAVEALGRKYDRGAASGRKDDRGATSSRQDYERAAKYIAAARLWPENLGVGKPYDDEIDGRLEDWMEYVARGGKSGELLDRILAFKPRVDNTVRNFIPSNALVTAWAMEKKQGRDQAIIWLDEQAAAFPAFGDVLRWCKTAFENGRAVQFSGVDANVDILSALMEGGANAGILEALMGRTQRRDVGCVDEQSIGGT